MSNTRHLRVLVIILCLLLPSGLSAQCKKRINVYIDVSGSMKPEQMGDSPFAQTVGALEALLAEEGFLGDQDELRIVLFGEEAIPRATAHGSSEQRQLLQSLSEVEEEPDTNFASVFADIESNFSGSSHFDRELVILASDFAHEPRVHRNAALPSISDWEEVFSNHALRLKEIFSDSVKRRLLLLKAPAAGNRIKIQAEVLEDLVTGLLTEVHPVQGSQDQVAALAQLIRSKFLTPLEVTAWASGGAEARVRIANPSCSPLTLQTVQLACSDSEGERLGDWVHATNIPNSRLGAIGSGTDTSEITFTSLPRCPADSGYLAKAMTAEGSDGSDLFGTQNEVEIEIKKASLKQWGIGETLYLVIEMHGQVLESQYYEFHIKDSANKRRFFIGELRPPEDLTPDKRPYRFAVSSARFPNSPALGDQIELSAPGLTIRDAPALKIDRIPGFISIAAIILTFTLFLAAAVLEAQPSEFDQETGRRRAILRGGLGVASVLVMTAIGLMRPDSWEWVRLIFFSALVAYGVVLLVRHYHERRLLKERLARIEQELQLEDLGPHLRQFSKRLGSGIRSLAAGVLVGLLFLAILGALREGPPDVDKSIPRIEVQSHWWR